MPPACGSSGATATTRFAHRQIRAVPVRGTPCGETSYEWPAAGKGVPPAPSGSRSRDTGVIRHADKSAARRLYVLGPPQYLVKRLTRQIGTLSLRLNSDSELPEVESAGFHRGSFGGAGSGVADEHVGAVQWKPT